MRQNGPAGQGAASPCCVKRPRFFCRAAAACALRRPVSPAASSFPPVLPGIIPSRVQFSPGIARHHPLLRPVSPRNVRLSSESPGFPSAAPVFSQKTPWNSPRGGCLLPPSRFRRQFFCVHGFVFFNLARILQYTTCTELKSSGLQRTAGALHKRYYHNWRYIL